MRKVALLLCLMVIVTSVPAFAAQSFEKGTPGTHFTTLFETNVTGYDHIIQKYYLTKDDLANRGAKACAVLAKQFLDAQPEGRHIIQIQPALTSQLTENAEAYFLVSDEDFNKVKEEIDGFFKALYEAGGTVDYVFDDMEAMPSIYQLENMAIANYRLTGETVQESYTLHGEMYEEYIKNLILDLQSHERYKSELRPALEEAGFVFSDNYDLEYINIHPGALEPRKTRFYESNPPEGAENDVAILTSVISTLAEEKYDDAVCDTILSYYPNCKISNWRGESLLSSDDIKVYDFNGNPVSSKKEKPLAIGTHANWVFYSNTTSAGNLKTRPPEDWRYDTYEMTAFSELFSEYIQMCSIWLSDHRQGFSAWISTNDHTYDQTDYYKEMVFHVGMFKPEPFLYWASGTDEADIREQEYELIGKLFAQLDDLVGFEDRTPMLAELWQAPDWNQRYLLSGMTAGGKTVWRITPDLYTPGVTIENFLVDKKTPKFRIGNQCIDFPSGSYIYEPDEKLSDYGYWVITPEGERPTEYRAADIAMPAAPVAGENGYPTGYKYSAGTEMPDERDLSESKEVRKNKNNNNSSDDRNNSGETVNQPTNNETETRELKLNPIKGSGSKTDIFTSVIYDDMKGHWAEHTLANMYSLGIMNGSGDGMEPDSYVTKAEFIAMLSRVLGAEQVEYAGGFSDISSSDWYKDVMNTAVVGGWISADIVSGNLNPETNLTRAAMCRILQNALKLESSTSEHSFTDAETVGGANRESIYAVAELGLMEGYEDGSFKPNNVLTRAEAAVVFERLLAKIPVLFQE